MQSKTTPEIALSKAAAVSAGVNVAMRLSKVAITMPDAIAIAQTVRNHRSTAYDLPTDVAQGPPGYRCISFAQLDADSTNLAAGLQQVGIKPGMRIALLVRPGINFVSLVFALLKLSAIQVLVDPGMGLRKVIRSLAEVQPHGLIGGATVQIARRLLKNRFPAARFNITVNRSLLPRSITLTAVRRTGAATSNFQPIAADTETPAAIIFTSGSTGPAKGVLYRHGNFDQQVAQIQNFYDIQPGEIDISCFPLFGLFNAAMGVTSVIPEMNVSRPARVDPRRIVAAVNDWQATQAFGSPAVWNVVGRYCEANSITLPSLRRVLSSGAPVAAHVLRRMTNCIHSHGDMHTPYGATEALPVASIAASTVLKEAWSRTEQGHGVCVGNKFDNIRWRIIRITDEPIGTFNDAEELPRGQIGEIIIQGPAVTTEYVANVPANLRAKIKDGPGFWHRMGDVGYLDEQDRFWFCGRMSQRVTTPATAANQATMFTIPCEAIFNRHPHVSRSALVGVGPIDAQQPAIVIEPRTEHYPHGRKQREKLIAELHNLAESTPGTSSIQAFLFRKSLPVDVRHNVKINREELARWAARKLGRQADPSKQKI